MAAADLPLVSADSHVVEPADLWTSRDRTPQVAGARARCSFASTPAPHTDSTWPRSRDVIARDFAGVPAAELTRIVQLYGFSS